LSKIKGKAKIGFIVLVLKPAALQRDLQNVNNRTACALSFMALPVKKAIRYADGGLFTA